VIATLVRGGRTVLALFLTVILASLFHAGPLPWFVLPALMLLALLSAWRPSLAALFVAAVTPLATFVGRSWNPQVAWAEAIVIAFASGWNWRQVFAGPEGSRLPPALRFPATSLVLVVIASVVVQASVDQLRFGTAGFGNILWQFFSRDYFVSGSDQYLHAGALLLEGVLLFSIAAQLADRDPRFATHMAIALAGPGSIAAAMNLEALVGSALRSGEFWTQLAQHVRTTRINVHYGDVNAAGSHFGMLMFVSAALGMAGRRTARLWFVGTALLALGVWLSGSRAALFACPLALAIAAVAVADARTDKRTRFAVRVAGAVLASAAIGLVAFAPMRGNQKSSSIAAQVRVEMARTTMRMVASSPAFGIGLGQFYQRSGEFSSPALVQLFPRAVHENAHNNFLQVLAETGIFGFAVFTWLIAAAVDKGWRHARWRPGDVVAWGCLTGVVAFILTWLAGHPLLTREPAYAFWLLLGVVAGTGVADVPDRASTTRARWLTPALAAVAVLLLASLPFRAGSARARADLDHFGIGLSQHWETAADGVRYRSATGEASLFVPGETGFRLKVRAISKEPERLELRIGGRLADIVPLMPDRWTEIAMPRRNDRATTRFVKMDLRVLDPAERGVTMWVSKVEQLGQ
jgi:O-antigen ligase